MPEEKEQTKENDIAIVMELPTQPYNQVEDDKGNKIDLISLTEAVREIYKDVKVIKKAIA